MATPENHAVTADREEITFELDRVSTGEPGRLEIRGRWFGIRGRRFVRPTLTLQVGGASERLLAALEHKPWAAEEGEEWVAAFGFPFDLDDASRLELSVAPDIAVRLNAGEGGTAVAERAPSAPAPAAGRRSRPGRASPAARSRETERLGIRLSELEGALARERARRAAVEQELEDERVEALRLRSGAAQLSADLDLSRAARLEADAELEQARRMPDRRQEENRRLLAEIEELRERLSGARRREAEAGRLRAEADRLRAEISRLRSEPARAASMGSPVDGRHDGAGASSDGALDPEVTERLEALLGEGRQEPVAATPRRKPAPPLPVAPRPVARPGTAAEPPRLARHDVELAPRSRPGPERPLNPSLQGPGWIGRMLPLLIILVVMAAVILVIRTTMS